LDGSLVLPSGWHTGDANGREFAIPPGGFVEAGAVVPGPTTPRRDIETLLILNQQTRARG
jgi:hypothetical protein